MGRWFEPISTNVRASRSAQLIKEGSSATQLPWLSSSGWHDDACAVPQTVLFLDSDTVVTHSSFPAGISELRWAPVSKAGSIHVVNSGKALGQTGKTLLYVAVS